MADFFKQLNKNYGKLSESEKEVIDFILGYQELEHLKLKTIMTALFVSSTTIIRACKKIGYKTFNSLKYDALSRQQEISLLDKDVQSIQKIIDTVSSDFSKTIQLFDENQVDKICNLILESRRVFCVGIGSSTTVVADFNRKLKLIDIWSNDYFEQFSIERIPTICMTGDIIIVFSLSGFNEDINIQMLQAKQRGAKIISITSISANPLNTISDVSLYVHSSTSTRRKLRSRLMLYVASDLIFESLLLKMPSME